jgi:hypothetical protein
MIVIRIYAILTGKTVRHIANHNIFRRRLLWDDYSWLFVQPCYNGTILGQEENMISPEEGVVLAFAAFIDQMAKKAKASPYDQYRFIAEAGEGPLGTLDGIHANWKNRQTNPGLDTRIPTTADGTQR